MINSKHAPSRASGSRESVEPRTYASPACFAHEFEVRSPGEMLRIKGVYDEVGPADGFRLYVGRVLPPRVSRRVKFTDAWMPALAPSAALLKWFRNKPELWPEFCRRYAAEMREQAAALDTVREKMRFQRVTLLHSAKLPWMNHVTVLAAILRPG
jgi:uncharacterized protein YeaO (DUF488 family)